MRFVKTAENLFGLPQGFTRVEYLESSGTQYIDTNFKPNPTTTRFELSYSTTRSTSTFPFGARVNSSFPSTASCTSYISDTSIRADWAGSNSVAFSTTSGKINNLTCENNKMILDGSDYQGTVDKSSSYIDYNFLLFNMWDGTSGVRATGFTGKFYKAKLWDNGTLVRDYIPALDPVGVPCMYDLVGKKPYYNIGTGTFTAGRQIIPVEYLESTGTQYINTGVRGFADFEIGIKLRENVSNVSIFCGNNYRLERYNASNPYWRFRNDNNFYSSGIPITEYHVMAWKNDEVYADGVKLQDFAKTWNVSANMILFGASASGSYPGMIYFCKLWNPTDGTLLRDYIPCKDENDNGFLFDKLSGDCYLNNGTGNFAFGENKYKTKLRLIKDNKLPAGYTQVEYLESSGAQRITTDVSVASGDNFNLIVNGAFTTLTGYSQFMGINGGAYFGLSTTGYYSVGQSTGTATGVLADTDNHTFDLNCTIGNNQTNILKIDGTSYSNVRNNSAGDVRLFDVLNSYACYFKMAGATIYKNNTLVRNFIPAIDPTGTPCMYDLVSKAPFYNAGTGTFSTGKPVLPMVRFIKDIVPREYAVVNYLESTGTQYIDTGVEKGSVSVIRTVADLSFNNLSTINAAGWGQSLSGGCFGFKQNATYIYFNLTGADENSTLGYIAGKRLKFDLDGVNGKFTIYDGESVAYTATKTSSTSTNNNIGILFGFKNTSGINAKAQTIYSYKMYKNNVLVRNFIPVVRRIDKVAGMWDTVTKQFYGNSGTGNFNYGV